MKIQVGDIVGLVGQLKEHVVKRIVGNNFLLDDGHSVLLSDIHFVRSNNGNGTAKETFSDGRVREVEV
jgi:hypothetical protein